MDHAAHPTVHQTHHGRGDHVGHQDHHDHHDHNAMPATNAMAASATLHCLTGCAIGEIAGLMIGTAVGLSTGWTIALAVALAFLFGYALSTLPLLKVGLGVGTALSLVLAADTLSIAVMELVDNLVMALIPGAMDAGLVNPVFWLAMTVALTAAFLAAFPVNRYLLQRGKGHALMHRYHGAEAAPGRRFVPSLPTSALAAALAGFLLAGFVVSLAAELEGDEPAATGHASAVADPQLPPQ